MLSQGYAAGLDVGGTKIAAQLFDSDWNILAEREVPTPSDSYAALLDGIVGEISWLKSQGAGAMIPTGIGIPGIVDTQNGAVLTANLPASGKPLRRDIADRLAGLEPVMLNDCRAFALSEAVLGAGRGHDMVLGLVIGTGLAGGLVHGGELIEGSNGAAGEYGHISIAADLQQRHDLPILPCGCGRSGCYETLCSGAGLSRIVKHVLGHDFDANVFGMSSPRTAEELQPCFAIWIDLLSELLTTLSLTIDPECVVLGGGASRIPGLVPGLTDALDAKLLAGMAAPVIALAEGGPQSGARGAALAATMARMMKP